MLCSTVFDSHPMMALTPVGGVFHLVQRSPRCLRDYIWDMQRSLFSLEPIRVVDAVMSNMMREVESTRHGGKCSLDAPKDVFEVGEDGKLNFKVYFNAKDYKPEDISVEMGRNEVSIKAKKVVKEGNARVEEFVGRCIPLPSSVDTEKLKATLTKDDVLVVEAPVKAPEYKCIEVEGKEEEEAREVIELQPAEVEGRELALNNGSRKMHVEMVVGEHFSPSDVKIWTQDGQMFVSGAVRKEERSENAMRSESYEFRRSFPVPEDVDVKKLKAEMAHGHLLVEAPINS